MSRISHFTADDRVHEDDICDQADMSETVALTDVMRHLELIVAAPNGTGDALAARGALNAIKVLAEQANVDPYFLGVQVR